MIETSQEEGADKPIENTRGRTQTRGAAGRGMPKRANSSITSDASPKGRAIRTKAKVKTKIEESLVENTDSTMRMDSTEEQKLPDEQPATEGGPGETKRGVKRTSDGAVKVSETLEDVDLDGIAEEGMEEQTDNARPQKKRGRVSKKPSLAQKTKEQESSSSIVTSRIAQKISKVDERELMRPEGGISVEPHSPAIEVAPKPPPHTVLVAAKSPERASSDSQERTISEVAATASPSSSSQSSNVENQPPSSRPSLATNSQRLVEESPPRSALVARTPVVSPSKRNIIAGNLISSHPWQGVDLDTILLLSPSARQAASGRGNASVADVLANLSSPERQMNVEEWILWNAKQAEERLKRDCERMIGIFENEGLKAIRTMEGIECAF